MNRRDFGMAGLGGAALALTGLAHAQQSKFQDSKRVEVRRGGINAPGDTKADLEKHKMHGEHMLACAKACSDCQRECDTCAAHCAHKIAEGKKEHLTTLKTCQDCADFCVAASQIVARGGPFAMLICAPCAEACAACGKECEKFPDDEHMKRCAAECRKCEKACREMLKHGDHAHD
jgi:hypothetical protein